MHARDAASIGATMICIAENEKLFLRRLDKVLISAANILLGRHPF
jgi:hypothetical protein